jgi:uncharacterized repeat protein (TIGR03833 family)
MRRFTLNLRNHAMHRGRNLSNRSRSYATSASHQNRRDPRRFTNASSGPVPSSTDVVPGAAVSIVLKQDQPTGRQVQGVVQDVLSRGDHPRGIKVRLNDGRVGRVQRMADNGEATMANDLERTIESDSVYADVEEPAYTVSFRARGRNRRRGGRVTVSESSEPYIPKELSLADYIRGESTIGTNDKSNPQRSRSEGPEFVATCPICHDFTGDETAVSHHVNEHFK